jgi:hypothetical protein
MNTKKNSQQKEVDGGDLDIQELACQLVVLAAKFSAASIMAYTKAHPDHAAALAQTATGSFVKISEILSQNPRVAYVNTAGGEECEIAKVQITNHHVPGVDRRILN